MAWLEEDDLEDKWTQVIDSEGEIVGWTDNYNATLLNLDYHTVETPKRFLIDPWVRQQAIAASAQDLLSGNNLSEIQSVLAITMISKKQEDDEALRVRQFEELMWVTNQELWKSYTERKQQLAEQSFDEDVEETTPQSVEEFFEALNAFTEEYGSVEEAAGEGQDDGWLDMVLDDDELSQMGD